MYICIYSYAYIYAEICRTKYSLNNGARQKGTCISLLYNFPMQLQLVSFKTLR